MSKSETPPVRKPYKAEDFDKAVDRVSQQRCQRCEGKLKFNNQMGKPNKKVVTLDAVCTECQHRHGILFEIANLTVRG
jgi:hypothetical protein